jgi:hypothetical protein
MILGSGTCSTIRCGVTNVASGNYSAALSGLCNTASTTRSTISGGYFNTASDCDTFIGGGRQNTASSFYATVVGGRQNTASAYYSFIGGGFGNTASGGYSFVGGGGNNKACGYKSFVGGGYLNIVNNCSLYGFIGGGKNNCICSFSNQQNLTEGSVITGGTSNTISGYYNEYNFIGGGISNSISGQYLSRNVIVGGLNNRMCGSGGAEDFGLNFIGGGGNNIICVNGLASTNYSGILGGDGNLINSSNNNTFIIGSNLTSSASCTTYTNALSKASGTFRINHPDPSKTATKYLQHSFVESPTRGDNIYRYVVCAVGCAASLKLPSYYKFLNENDQVWVTPKSHLGYGFGVVNEEQTNVDITTNADGEYNVLIIGTRKDIDAMNGFTGVEQFK